MTQPYLGEIRMFAGNFAPRHNALCAGQLLSIPQNSALFSVLGTAFGGNGTTTFGLPNFGGSIPVSQGQAPALSNYVIGQQGGTEAVALTLQQMPMHNHLMLASSNQGNQASPLGNMPAGAAAPFTGLWVAPDKTVQPTVPMDANSLSYVGGTLPHENRMPAIAISIIIALQGVFPTRN